MKILRTHWKDANLQENFTILDETDKKVIAKMVIAEFVNTRTPGDLNLKDSSWKELLQYIEHQKGACSRPSPRGSTKSWKDKGYSFYEEECQRCNVVDFDEILLRTLELLQKQPDVALRYHKKFKHFLVDEYQDTNYLQYQLLQELSRNADSVVVVGDDDQSIYEFRGACDSMQRFLDNSPSSRLVKLEGNYRSTSAILDASNALIVHNSKRIGKTLRVAETNRIRNKESNLHEEVKLHFEEDDNAEAKYIADTISEKVSKRHKVSRNYSDIAILYRTNAQSGSLQKALTLKSIPYTIRGGRQLVDTEEGRHLLAFMTLLANPHNDPSFKRICNVPSRGLSSKTIDALEVYAWKNQKSL